MTKPSITPIVMNRDVTSDFLSEIQNSNVKPIEPVFLDFKKDLSQLKAKSNIPVLYKQNTSNDLFQLIYVFDMGNNNDKVLGTTFDYIDYLGTSDMTPEQLKSEFYRLACTFRVVPGEHARSNEAFRKADGRCTSQQRGIHQYGGRYSEIP